MAGYKFYRFLFILVFYSCFISISRNLSAQDSCSLRISLITCGPGQDLYSVYGHSAVRVVDSCTGRDIVYNYGTFNFGDPDFYSKFTRGKLQYYLNEETFAGFMSQYVDEQRSVYEQVLELNQNDALAVYGFLNTNLKEENKYYKYDFLFDNCSTRIRDLFATLFGDRVKFYPIMANDSVSFRKVLDHYERNVHWERFGINLLMSDVVDRKMKSYESMFLPDYLMRGFDHATLDGKMLVKGTKKLLPDGRLPVIDKLNEPRLYFWILFGLILLLSFSKKMQPLLMYFDVLFFMILGLLGWLMLFMWFGTEHKVCAWNRNLLWAFPLHLVFAFLIPRRSELAAKYAKYAGWLVIAGVFYNLVGAQKYISEITPLLLLILLRLNHYSKQLRYFSANAN